jgi:hypothetical protein
LDIEILHTTRFIGQGPDRLQGLSWGGNILPSHPQDRPPEEILEDERNSIPRSGYLADALHRSAQLALLSESNQGKGAISSFGFCSSE